MTARNRTLTLSDAEQAELGERLLCLDAPVPLAEIQNRTLCQAMQDALPFLPDSFVDLLILDPPYNLTKQFYGATFSQRSDDAYIDWLRGWLPGLVRLLKSTASVYVCGDWRTSFALYAVLREHFIIRNRITWERDKGRGAVSNWKNNAEDIWFCTLGESYTFNVEAVKLRRRVVAPYRDEHGDPKDWDGNTGFRLTHPANLWTDISVPFWSMPENTAHPTQKPEKLVAKLVLASSNPGDVVFDPFLGSGTSSVVAKKLGRVFVGVEQEAYYACLAEKRLALADANTTIQGYQDGVFWERNTHNLQQRKRKK